MRTKIRESQANMKGPMDKRLFFLINKARHNLNQRMDRRMSQAIDVPIAQVTALLALEVRDGCRQKELGHFLGLNKSGTTGLVSRMEENQLIKRASDLNDARAIRIYIDVKGKTALQKAKPIVKAANSELQQDFSDDEMATVYRFLNHVSKPQ